MSDYQLGVTIEDYETVEHSSFFATWLKRAPAEVPMFAISAFLLHTAVAAVYSGTSFPAAVLIAIALSAVYLPVAHMVRTRLVMGPLERRFARLHYPSCAPDRTINVHYVYAGAAAVDKEVIDAWSQDRSRAVARRALSRQMPHAAFVIGLTAAIGAFVSYAMMAMMFVSLVHLIAASTSLPVAIPLVALNAAAYQWVYGFAARSITVGLRRKLVNRLPQDLGGPQRLHSEMAALTALSRRDHKLTWSS